MNITPTPSQDTALKLLKAWKSSTPRQPFLLKGYAGTGKSTMMPLTIEALGAYPERTLVLTPTGKSRLVVKNKLMDWGLQSTLCLTIASALYTPSEAQILAAKDKYVSIKAELDACVADGTATPAMFAKLAKADEILRGLCDADTIDFKVNDKQVAQLKADYDLIITDETSMIDPEAWNILTNIGIPLVGVGDGFQLPPVNAEDWFYKAKADVELTDVMRQAKGSAILEFANALRRGSVDPYEYEGEDFKVISEYDQNRITSIATDEDAQILCGSNKNCAKYNRLVRQAYGCTSNLPEAEDRLMVTKNRQQQIPTGILNEDGTEMMRGGMVNGEVLYTNTNVEHLNRENSAPIIAMYEKMRDQYLEQASTSNNEHMRNLFTIRASKMRGQINTLETVIENYKGAAGVSFAEISGCQEPVPIVVNLWTYLPERELNKVAQNYGKTGGDAAYFWNTVRKVTYTTQFAYAVTTHKYQGSQSEKVVGINDVKNWPMYSSVEKRRHLYTTVTRAQDKFYLAT